MAKKTINSEAGTIVFDFGDAGSATFELDKVPAEVQRQLMLHGMSQKGGDSYAGAKAACADSGANPEEWALGQVTAVIQQIYDGNWSVRASGGSSGSVTDLAKALAEVSGSELQDCVTRLGDASKEEKAALRKHPGIALVLARFREERQAAKKAALEEQAANAPDLSGFLSG